MIRMAEAQRLFGVSRTSLYRMASKGDVIFVKLGGRTLVDFATLKAAVRRLPRAVINIAA
jgi:excisionase family DNA binding protein